MIGLRSIQLTRSLPRQWAAIFLFALMMIVTGCSTMKHEKQVGKAVQAYYAGDYPRAQEKLRPLAAMTDEDFVLNNVRLGSALLADYRLDDAEAAFLKAYEVINSVGVNNGGRSLGAVLVDEKMKIWKGEPFERAMTNFYLGLIYYMRQDYNNARAAFENALFKLQDAGADGKEKTPEIESNFTLASIMLAKCWQKLGDNDKAYDNFLAVRNANPQLQALCDERWNAESNVLLVIDYGYGPRKVTDFDGSIVGFSPTPSDEGSIPDPVILVDGKPFNIGDVGQPTIDLLAMGQDRKWQSLDTFRAIKSAVGTGLIAGGAGYGLYKAGKGEFSGQDAAIAGGLIAAGALLKATSQADVRQWEMLPRTVFLLPLKIPPGKHDIIVDFPGIRGLQQTWYDIVAPRTGEATYYFRMQRWLNGPFQWPPPGMGETLDQPAVTAR